MVGGQTGIDDLLHDLEVVWLVGVRSCGVRRGECDVVVIAGARGRCSGQGGVPSPGTNVTPFGSAPDSVMAGFGEPVATIRSVLLFPTVISPLVDVIEGATGGFVAPAGVGWTAARARMGAARMIPGKQTAARVEPASLSAGSRSACRPPYRPPWSASSQVTGLSPDDYTDPSRAGRPGARLQTRYTSWRKSVDPRARPSGVRVVATTRRLRR